MRPANDRQTMEDEDDFAAERERIEEKHRIEVLNLLKSFEFERKDIEARLRAEWEEAGAESSHNTSEFLQELEELDDKFGDDDDELRKRFEKEKEKFLRRIKELENEISGSREKEEYQKEENRSTENVATSTSDNEYDPTSSEGGLKSLYELEEDNYKLKVELDNQRDKVNELQDHIRVLNQKLHDIDDIVKNQVAFAEDKEKIRKIIDENFVASPVGRTETKDKQVTPDDPSGHHIPPETRSDSELNFQIEELNIENEELKSNVRELEKAIRKTVEEYELQRKVFSKKLHGILQGLEGGADEGVSQGESARRIDEMTLNELRKIRLEETPKGLLEKYTNIVLSEEFGSESPDVFEINFQREVQSLEHLLDIEIFDGRAFDEEMKDEVREVLREKERELLVAYALEKFRTELRHRFATESVLEELREEREREFKVHQATNELIKDQLGITGAEKDTKQVKDALLKYSKEESPNEKETDYDALKAEKEQLESALNELQDNFKTEREQWLNKLQDSLQDDSGGEDKEKVIQRLRAQKALMEQLLNTERFYLSRLYYFEMKDELDASLKQQQFNCSGKYEKERLNQAWKHHAEVGELYQQILEKEAEGLERIKEVKRPEGVNISEGVNVPQRGNRPNRVNMPERVNIPEKENVPERGNTPEKGNIPVRGNIPERRNMPERGNIPGRGNAPETSEDQLRNEAAVSDKLLALKLELVDLQRRRCREHKTASLILEQAVNAVETAVQESDHTLVSGNPLQRQSSWTSFEEDNTFDTSGAIEPGREGSAGQSSSEGVDSKMALRNALERILQKLLNQQIKNIDLEMDSYSSDSDFSEGSSEKEPASDEEAAGTNEGTRDTAQQGDPLHGGNEQEDPQHEMVEHAGTQHETSQHEVMEHAGTQHEDNKHANRQHAKPAASPELITVPRNIQDALNIERFNMSRLFRDEYLDKIRRNRQRVRRMKAQDSKNNEDVLTQFREKVASLLEKTDFGESGKGVSPKRPELGTMTSDDSGIADFAEADKDEVVKKYKELLEKARKDLNRARKELRKKSGGMDGIGGEVDEMKRNMKEREDDLKEIEEKRSGLDNERDSLLEKVKGETAPDTSSADNKEHGPEYSVGAEKESGEHSQERSDDSKRSELAEGGQEREPGHDSLGTTDWESGVGGMETSDEVRNTQGENGVSQVGRTTTEDGEGDTGDGVGTTEGENGVQSMGMVTSKDGTADGVGTTRVGNGGGTTRMENGVQSGGMVTSEEDGIEGSSSVAAGGKETNEELKQKVDEVEGEMDAQKQQFEEEIKKQQDEIKELQRKLVEGTGGEELLTDLPEKLNKAKEEKGDLEAKCSELEKHGAGLEKSQDSPEENDFEKVRNDNAVLENENKIKQDKIDELQAKLVEGMDGEEILKELQNELKEVNEKNKALEKEKRESMEGNVVEQNKDAEKITHELENEVSKLQGKNACLGKENKVKSDEIRELQKAQLDGSGSEAILDKLQDKIKELEDTRSILQKECRDLDASRKNLHEKEMDLKNENDKMAEVVRRLEKEKDYLGRESNAKTGEISKLQESLLNGEDGKDILTELQDRIAELEAENKELRKKCFEMESSDNGLEREDEVKDKSKENEIEGSSVPEGMKTNQELERKVDELEREMDAQKRQFEEENRKKQDEVNELQRKLVEGTGGEKVLSDLQEKLNNAEEEKQDLEAKCSELEKRAGLEKNQERIKPEENDFEKMRNENAALESENKIKQDKIDELQTKLVEGTDGEEILEGLQNELKELTEKNKALEKEKRELLTVSVEQKEGEPCVEKITHELENEVSKLQEENACLGKENKVKSDEIRELQKAQLDGSGSEAILDKLQDKIKELEDTRSILQKECRDLDALRKNLQEKEMDLKKENDEMAEVARRLEKEKDCLQRESNAKTGEISKLQESLLNGEDGKDILTGLQDKIAELQAENKELRKKCFEMESGDNDVERKDEVKDKSKENEIEESGVLEGMKTNEDLEQKVSELEKEIDAQKRQFEEENRKKQDEVDELQRKLVEENGGEKVLSDLQEKLNNAEEEKQDLEAKCSELEKRAGLEKNQERIKPEENDFEKMRNENAALESENKIKQDKIDELQTKLVEGTDGEEILEGLQNELKELTEKNKALEKEKRELLAVSVEQKEGEPCVEKITHELENEVSKLQEENACLGKENKLKSDEIRELQKAQLDGSGSEAILDKLQDKIKELEDTRSILQKECRDLDALRKNLQEKEMDLKKENDEMEEVARRLEKEKDYLQRESNAKTGEISKLQESLLNGEDGKGILTELQDRIAELEAENKELRKKCFEMESGDNGVERKDEVKDKSKENEIGESSVPEGMKTDEELERKVDELEGEMGAQKRQFEEENRTKQDEVNELQRKLVEENGGEKVLSDLQEKLNNAEEEKQDLEAKCSELEKRAGLEKNQERIKPEENDFEKTRNDIAVLENENKLKQDKIDELQTKLVEGTDGEEILEGLQNELKELTEKNKALEKEKRELLAEIVEQKEGEPGVEKITPEFDNEVPKLQEENAYLAKENKLKSDEIRDLQKAQVDGSGSEAILDKLQDKIEELEETRVILQKECRDLDASRKKLQEKEMDLKNENDEMAEVVRRLEKEKDYLERESNAKTSEISKLQERLLNGEDGKDILTGLQDKIAELQAENKELRKKCFEMESGDNDVERKDEVKDKSKENEIEESGVLEGMKTNEDLEQKVGELEREIDAQKRQFEEENRKKQDEVNELQRKLVEGTGGEKVLSDLQEKLNNAEEEKQDLEAKCSELEKRAWLEKNRERIKPEENDFEKIRHEIAVLENGNKLKQDKIDELQAKLVEGTDGEEILEGLQNELKELTEKNKALENEKRELLEEGVVEQNGESGAEKITHELENEVSKLQEENACLAKENKLKSDEMRGLQKAQVDGSGSEAVLDKLQDKIEELEETRAILQKECRDLDASRKNLHEKEMDSKKENDKMAEVVRILEKEKDYLERESNAKTGEISKLQERLLNGEDGKDILTELQDKFAELEAENKELRKKCFEMGSGDNGLEREDEVKDGSKENEIEEGSVTGEMKTKEKLERKVNELEGEMDAQKRTFEEENRRKQDEVNDLQRKLVEGIGGDKVLSDLQEKLNNAEEEKRDLEIKCSELEKDAELEKSQERIKPEENDFDKIRKENAVLENENKMKQDEIDKLQAKLVAGTDGEEILKELQNELKELNEKNKALEKESRTLLGGVVEEKGEPDVGMKDLIAELEQEKDVLAVENIEMVKKVEKLQNDLLQGTGSENVLAELQREVKDLKDKNKELEKKCGKDDDVEGLKKKMDQLKNEIEALNKDNKKKDDEIDDLQRKLVKGSGGEEVLTDLQQQMKILKDNNADFEIRCKELDNLLGEVKDEKTKLENEVSKLQEKSAYLAKENKVKSDELRDLQKAQVDGSGSEAILDKLQDKIEELEETRAILQKECRDLDSSRKNLQEKEMDLKKENDEMAEVVRRLEKEKDYLERESNAKTAEISELQERLLNGEDGMDILREVQGENTELLKENNELRKKCLEMERKKGSKDKSKEMNTDLKEIGPVLLSQERQPGDECEAGEKQGLVGRESGDSGVQSRDSLGTSAGEASGNGIVLDGGMETNEKLKQKVDKLEREMVVIERKAEEEKQQRGEVKKEVAKMRNENDNLERVSKEKTEEILNLQKKIAGGSGCEDILKGLQDQVKELEDVNKGLKKKCLEMESREGAQKNGKKDEVTDALKIENQQQIMVEGDKGRDKYDPGGMLENATGKDGTLQGKELTRHREEKLNDTQKEERDRGRDEDEAEEERDELRRLRAENDKLLNENEEKDDEICRLQNMLVEGRGGNDLLQELQENLKGEKEKNKALEKKCKKMEGLVDEEHDGKDIEKVKEENEYLKRENEEKGKEIDKLQHDVMKKTGSEDILIETKNKMEELQNENQFLKKKIEEKGQQMEKMEEKPVDELKDEDERLLDDNGNKDSENLKKENEYLKRENEEKGKEIDKLQQDVMKGTGSEDVLAKIKNKMEELQNENRLLKEDTANKGQQMEKMEEKRMDGLKDENRKLLHDNRNKENEIFDLQRKILDGTGQDVVLSSLQDQQMKLREQNEKLKKGCEDLEETNAMLEDHIERMKEEINEVSRLKHKNDQLESAKEDGRKQILDLQRKLADCSVGSIGSPKRKKESRTRGKMGKSKKSAGNVGFPQGEDKDEDEATRKLEKATDHKGDEVPSYDECLEAMPKLVEERDHWKEKYGALRDKVGGSFVDIIPEVWQEEAELEKDRDETATRLSEVKKEMGEKGTPLVKNMSEKERVERELEDVEDRLEDCSGQLDHIRDLREQEARIKEQQSMLRKCLEELEVTVDAGDDIKEADIKSGSVQDELSEKVNQLRHEADALLREVQGDWEQQPEDGGRSKLLDEKIKTKKEIRNLEQAIQELQPISSGATRTGAKSSSDKEVRQGAKPGKSCAIQGELEDIDKEVDELQSSLEESNASTRRDFGVLVGLMKEKSKLEEELATADKALGQLSKRDQENLLKERTKQKKVAKRLLELSQEKELAQNELQEVEASLREKEAELIASFERKQDEASQGGKGVSKSRRGVEGTSRSRGGEGPSGRQGGKGASGTQGSKETSRRSSRGSSTERDAGDSTEDESIEAGFEEVKLPSSEDIVALSEELGSIIQKKSSLGVRLESLGKEITAQSQKVEKSLLGVKEGAINEKTSGETTPVEATPGGTATTGKTSLGEASFGETTLEETTLGGIDHGSSFSSIDNLTQSQLSLFDNPGLVDELSLATEVVKDERVKRKSSRKPPVAKLLKEKASLDKKLKELDGRSLVQNAKIRNALREVKDPGKAQAKFLEAIEERKRVEENIAGVLQRIEEAKVQSDEFAGKGDKTREGSQGKTEKGSKSLSKNDKRRLLSQRESLAKQMEVVQERIEDYTTEEGLEDFPEMAEAGDVAKTVERLRELVQREVQLRRDLEGIASDGKLPSGTDKKRTLGSDVIGVLQREMENKEAKLAELENGGKTDEKDDKNLKKVEDLKKNIEMALNDLVDEEEAVKEELGNTEGNEMSSVDEKNLTEEVVALQGKKEELANELEKVQEFLEGQQEFQEPNGTSENYEEFAQLKNEEEELERHLDDVNRKLLRRKEWAKADDAVATGAGDVDSNLAESYGEILKRMEDEGLNMADLIRELEVTQETLSREREITGELLELVKSRVGNELMDALTGDGLVSPSVETKATAGGYQAVAVKEEHDSVTVAEIIDEYKKMNEASSKENQRLNEMMELLKKKLDEDLFDTIVNDEAGDVEISKKTELSKILENDDTIFEQISGKQSKSDEDGMRLLEDENEKLKRDGQELDGENKRMEEELDEIKTKLETVMGTLDGLKKEKDELEKRRIQVDEIGKEDGPSKETVGELEEKVERVTKEFGDLKMEKEELERKLKDTEDEIQKVKKDSQELGVENERMKEELDELKKMGGELEEKVERVTKELGDLKVEKEQLGRKLKDTDDENKKLKKDSQELDGENERMKEELDELKKVVGRLEEEVEGVTKELDDLKVEKEGLGRKLKDTDVENKKVKKDGEELDEENKQMREELDELRTELESVLGTLDGLKKEKDELEKGRIEVEELGKEDGPSKKVVGELEEKVERTTKKLDGLEMEKEELERKLKDMGGENEKLKKDRKDLDEEKTRIKEELDELKNELESVMGTLGGLKKEKDDLEKRRVELGEFGKQDGPSKEIVEELEEKVERVTKELDDLKMEKEELERKLKDMDDVEERNSSLKEEIGKLKEQVAMVAEELDNLKQQEKEGKEENPEELKGEQIQPDYLYPKLEEAEKVKNELEKELNILKEEKDSVDKKLTAVEQERDETVSRLENAEKLNKEIKGELEKSHELEEELESVKTKLSSVESEYNDLVSKMGEVNKVKDEMEKHLEREEETKEENKRLKEKLAEMEDNEGSLKEESEDQKVDDEGGKDVQKEQASEAKGLSKEMLEDLRRLEELTEENSALREAVDVLEKENNHIIPTLENLKKTKKDLEDEVDYLRKENEDLQSMKKSPEHYEEPLREELDRLKTERNEVIDYIERELQGHVTAGVKEALEDYNRPLKEMEKECSLLKDESKKLKEVVGENLVNELLSIADKQQGPLEDTPGTPECIEKILTDQVTLGTVLARNEDERDLIEQRLGKELFRCVSGEETGLEDEPESLKLIKELKEGEKDLTGIVKAYEDVIEAHEKEMAEQAQGKQDGVDTTVKDDGSLGKIPVTPKQYKESGVQTDIVDSEDSEDNEGETVATTDHPGGEKKDFQDEEDKILGEPLNMETEYQDLLKKMVEHQSEIEDAEALLFEQKRQHEREKEALLDKFHKEKAFSQQQIDSERKSMEKAMQNLINEIVRLKEERKEIRKNNRMEKEKMENSFDKERAEFYSKTEKEKAGLQKEMEKGFQDVSEKEKKQMEQREEELREELTKLKNEKREIAAKLKETEKNLEEKISADNERTLASHLKGTTEANERMMNEFEDKLKQEKKKFEKTLATLRDEVDRLQKEREKTLNNAALKGDASLSNQEGSGTPVYSFGDYEKIKSDFRKRMQSEKATLENRIKELRGEKDELNRQKQEMKGNMRKQRLEMNKKHEKEKNELAEKYRNEVKELRNKLHEKKENENNKDASAAARSIADAHELQRVLREKDAKLRRYEMFFRELNREATVVQQDPAMTA